MNEDSVKFRGAQIQQQEVVLIKELEEIIDLKLECVEFKLYKSGIFKRCFTTQNNHVIGLNLDHCGIEVFYTYLVKP